MLLLLVQLLALSLIPVGAKKNGCWEQSTRKTYSGCKIVKSKSLVSMCRSCPVRHGDMQGGHFGDCKNIFDLDWPGCEAKLRAYEKAVNSEPG